MTSDNTNHTKKAFPGTHSLQTRVSFQSLRKGSITAEAAMAFPLFFIVIVCIVSVMNIYGTAADKMSSLRDVTETAAAAADVSDEELWIDITVPEYFRPFCLPDLIPGVIIPTRGRTRAWNGRSDAEKKAAAETNDEYVYLTENGSVYHTDSNCTHLELSTRSTPAATVEFLRNSDGSKYKPCEKCCRNGCAGHFVYITDDGDRYHSRYDCPGLKRTVRLVPASSVQGKCKCSRCAASGK